MILKQFTSISFSNNIIGIVILLLFFSCNDDNSLEPSLLEQEFIYPLSVDNEWIYQKIVSYNILHSEVVYVRKQSNGIFFKLGNFT